MPDTYPVYRIRGPRSVNGHNIRLPDDHGSALSAFIPSRDRQQASALRLYLTWMVTLDWLEFPAEVSTSRLAPLRASAGTTMFTW